MSIYRAPRKDMQFVLTELAGLAQISSLPGYEEASSDTVDAILEEASKFATDVLDPLNVVGDREGSVWQSDGSVKTPTGFKPAYRRFAEHGWNGLTKNPEHGGQGLPQLVATAVEEMWHGANMAFALCPLLTQGAIEAVELVGTPALKDKFLAQMVSGNWTGTMNLTESQAGSDLAAVRTRAVPESDSGADSAGQRYKLFGQKIFITYGEQDYTENIIHLVLARTPTAPQGVKGISLFVVPKFLVGDDGAIGPRNDVTCVSLEHKLGIHASPTAVLSYGDHGGAIGYLVGEENRGLEYMFIMMNLARFSVGLQGLGIAERAYQRAVTYAKERTQGRPVGSVDASAAPIIRHPDVRRMLMTMKAQIEAMRAVAYVTGAALDNARRHPDKDARRQHQAFADLMIPVVKGWCTETAQQITYMALQVHGGMGFIEETGAAQHYRDARIATIYEGTTAIQANDLIGRKTARDGGKTALAVIGEMNQLDAELARQASPEFAAIRVHFAAAVAALKEAVIWMAQAYGTDIRAAHAGSVPFLHLWGTVAGGWQLARSASIAAQRIAEGTGDELFYRSKIETARFYAECLLPQAEALKQAIVEGAASVLALPEEQF